jgi:hypothetical protein
MGRRAQRTVQGAMQYNIGFHLRIIAKFLAL